MARLPDEDRQRLTEQHDNLQIELGYLRQVATSILERVHVVGAQLNILELHDGSRTPLEDY